MWMRPGQGTEAGRHDFNRLSPGEGIMTNKYRVEANCPRCKRDFVSMCKIPYIGGGKFRKYCPMCEKDLYTKAQREQQLAGRYNSIAA